MNYIPAILDDIQSIDNLAIVTFEVQKQKMCMMSLGIDSSLSIGSEVTLGIKASNIALAKDLKGMISLSNQLEGVVKNIKNGLLLSSIKLEIADNLIIESIITLESAKKMNLQNGDKVLTLIKSSELSIVKVENI